MTFTITALAMLLAFFVVMSVRITIKYMLSEFKIGHYEKILKDRGIDISYMEGMTFKEMMEFIRKA